MGRKMLNGWKYTLAFEKCINVNGINYAGVGISPDEYISSENSISNGRDYVLEKAVELLE